jgi:sigma-B regulation protein RsbU (phosphoserine phosphatase)
VRVWGDGLIATLNQEDAIRALTEENARLQTENQGLRGRYAQVQSELRDAAAVQLSLLPTVRDVHPHFAVDWLLLPCSYLSGDNLNYFMMQDRYLIFYQLDVAGHGVASALLSVTLNQLLSPQPGSPMVRFDPQLELKRIVPPVDVVSELNRRFLPQGEGYFTMLYGVLDTVTREIRFCQAGHPAPLKFSADGTAETVGGTGFPVGLWPEMTYDETVTRLEAGERLLVYSDGVMACLNPDGAAYPVERMHGVVAGHPVGEALGAVKADLEAWTCRERLPDDVSMLLLVGR